MKILFVCFLFLITTINASASTDTPRKSNELCIHLYFNEDKVVSITEDIAFLDGVLYIFFSDRMRFTINLSDVNDPKKAEIIRLISTDLHNGYNPFFVSFDIENVRNVVMVTEAASASAISGNTGCNSLIIGALPK